MHHRLPPLSLALALLGGCSAADEPALTWYADAEPIVAAKCATCHQQGDIAPFPLTTWGEVEPMLSLVEYSVRSGSMPPWQPSDDCNEYQGDFSLTADEEATLLAWLEDGAPAGDPSERPAPTETAPPWEADLTLTLPEPYEPSVAPDDYRCQILEWPLDEEGFVTGVRVVPDQRQMVHHTILFAVSAEQADVYRQYDAEDDGPGYSCFGGPRPTSAEGGLPEGVDIAELLAALQSGEASGGAGMNGSRWIGSWVPGTTAPLFPEGTGLRMGPGDLVIAQFHYNTLVADAAADQSSIEFATAPTVEREAFVLPFTDVGWVTGLPGLGGPMDIPADMEHVEHHTSSADSALLVNGARNALGLDEESDLLVHVVGHHMHQLGTWGKQAVRHADGTESCLVEIPDWDFSWQGSYHLQEPVLLGADDALELGCAWDNSASNQQVIDGVPLVPTDVEWGEGTTDEMCLATLYVTAP